MFSDNFIRMYVDDHYHASLSVIHGLRCLNAVRIHLDADYYNSQPNSHMHQDGPGFPANFTRTHMSHCLDQIRQLITCASDLAPVPVRINKNIRVNGNPQFIASGAVHTCRKFDKVLDWLKMRKSTVGAFGEFYVEDYEKAKQEGKKTAESPVSKHGGSGKQAGGESHHSQERPSAAPLHPVRPTITRPKGMEKGEDHRGFHDRPGSATHVWGGG
jgi:hypothetical protein